MILTHVPIFDFIFHYTYLFKLFNLMSDKNKKTYSRSNIARYYKQLSMLQPAEKTILELFQDRLPNMKMLDIGIGGGRTTQHFGTVTAEYTGIDYSTEMIAACQQKFANSPQPMSLKPMSLKVVDARDMSQFGDNYFDFYKITSMLDDVPRFKNKGIIEYFSLNHTNSFSIVKVK